MIEKVFQDTMLYVAGNNLRLMVGMLIMTVLGRLVVESINYSRK